LVAKKLKKCPNETTKRFLVGRAVASPGDESPSEKYPPDEIRPLHVFLFISI